MKKAIAILLAVAFVLSFTAATAGAFGNHQVSGIEQNQRMTNNLGIYQQSSDPTTAIAGPSGFGGLSAAGATGGWKLSVAGINNQNAQGQAAWISGTTGAVVSGF